MVIARGERDPGQQQAAAGGGQPAGQLNGGAQVAERQAQQRLQLIGPRQQHRPGPGQDQPRRLDRGQRIADLPAGGPDPGPVEQRQELEGGPPPLRYRERLLGELLGGVEVAPLQREAGQRAQVIHGEKMLAESQPPRIRISGSGGIGGLSQVAGLEPCQRLRTGHQHQLDRFGELGHRQGRGCLALNCLEVFQPRIDTHEDHRDGGVPVVGELRPLLDGPRGEAFSHGLIRLAGQRVVQ